MSKEKCGAGGSDIDLGVQIRMLDNALRRRSEESPSLKSIPNMSMMNAWMILFLYEHDEEKELNVCQHHLEEEFGITRSAVSRNLKLMEEKGLIRRESVPGDARLKRIVLTQKARALSDGLRKDTGETEKLMRKGLTKQEVQQLQTLLGKVLKNLT